MTDYTTELLRVARALADALSDAAYSRQDEDKKRVAALQTELCHARHAEIDAANAAIQGAPPNDDSATAEIQPTPAADKPDGGPAD